MCALFGSSRDISLFIHLNKELLNNIIQQEVDFYQLHLSETKGQGIEDLYGEASAQKTYYRPTRLTCLIERQDIVTNIDDQFGMDKTQQVSFRFLRPSLLELGLVPKEGDIIELRGNYYEVDAVNENQFVVGKDGQYPKNVGTEFGENFSLICQTHMTRLTKLQISKGRA
jgi:hypothetical protein